MGERFYLQWHITNRCGNRCKHCYQHLFQGPSVGLKAAHLILEDFSRTCRELEVEPHMAVTGGDPFLNKHCFEILVEARKICSDLSVLGNPELLTPERVRKLQEIGIDRYQLSLDGMQQTHDSIRYPGSFDKTVQAIKTLRDAGIPVAIMSTVSKQNYGELADVMKLAYRLGASVWSFARWISNDANSQFIPAEYMAFLKDIQGAHEEFIKKGKSPLVKEPLLVLVQNNNEENHDCSKIDGGCGLGSAMLTLLPDNTLMGCRRHPGSVLGKWSKECGLLEYFVSDPQMKRFRRLGSIKGCRKCLFLKSCRGCRAAAFVATHDIMGKDPQCPF